MDRRLWAGLLALTLAACASSNQGGEEEPEVDNASYAPGRGEAAPTVRYERTAEGNWIKGEDAFQREEYLGAQRYFGYIRTKFPYSRYAVKSELRIADCQFQRGRHIEAIDSYQNFVRLHPTHEKVPYALYKVGMAYFEQIPSNFFLLPPAHEKDQSAVRDAARALGDYVSRFPDDENITEAKKVLDDVRRRLMAHERYVADFYKNLERDRAYVGRLEVIRREFEDVGLDDELLAEIVEAWVKLGELEKARSALKQMREKFPQSDELEDAESAIDSAPVKTSTSA
ncbi:MAG: outer membrane protein assembly factor BamD [Deltaproteobacteria bacterium]|jgi:outer membrane protein assembly factor BamD